VSFKKTLGVLSFAFCLSGIESIPAGADQVIMKDGTVYKGKIMIDTDKAILIGNPPYDPVSYLLESADIDKIIYEEYVPTSPAERKRGFGLDMHLTENLFSSSELTLHPATGLYMGGLFRVHPFFELEGGIHWIPAIGSNSEGLSITQNDVVVRQYRYFWEYSGQISGRFYPFFQKKWRTEPYVSLGYGWSQLVPKGSGDRLSGEGWHVGFGAQRPLTRHLFLEVGFTYESIGFDTIHFLGDEGSITPDVREHRYALNAGVSYRL
jgi:hypothetical protein